MFANTNFCELLLHFEQQALFDYYFWKPSILKLEHCELRSTQPITFLAQHFHHAFYTKLGYFLPLIYYFFQFQLFRHLHTFSFQFHLLMLIANVLCFCGIRFCCGVCFYNGYRWNCWCWKCWWHWWGNCYDVNLNLTINISNVGIIHLQCDNDLL